MSSFSEAWGGGTPPNDGRRAWHSWKVLCNANHKQCIRSPQAWGVRPQIVHLKAGEEVEKKDFVAEDVPEDGGLEARKVDSEGEEVPQEAKNNQPSPRAF